MARGTCQIEGFNKGGMFVSYPLLSLTSIFKIVSFPSCAIVDSSTRVFCDER